MLLSFIMIFSMSLPAFAEELSNESVAFSNIGVPIDEEHFPDANFRMWMSYFYDRNYDKYISENEISEVSGGNLYIDGTNIQNFKGIEYFTNINGYVIENSTINGDLNFSGCTNLSRVTIKDSTINGELNLSGYTNLNRITIDNCTLSKPLTDYSSFTKLNYLNYSNNKPAVNGAISLPDSIKLNSNDTIFLENAGVTNIKNDSNLNFRVRSYMDIDSQTYPEQTIICETNPIKLSDLGLSKADFETAYKTVYYGMRSYTTWWYKYDGLMINGDYLYITNGESGSYTLKNVTMWRHSGNSSYEHENWHDEKLKVNLVLKDKTVVECPKESDVPREQPDKDKFEFVDYPIKDKEFAIIHNTVSEDEKKQLIAELGYDPTPSTGGNNGNTGNNSNPGNTDNNNPSGTGSNPMPPTTPGTDTEIPFTDVPENRWFLNAVKYVYANKIMKGIAPTTFAPEDNCTREQMVEILCNSEGRPTVEIENPFTDNIPGKWYNNAICWAYSTGVTCGISPTEFGVGQDVTREQMAGFLYKYATYKGYDTSKRADLTRFPDSNQISRWAVDFMQWANAYGIINGKHDIYLDPKGTATRAEVAQMIKNFNEIYGR